MCVVCVIVAHICMMSVYAYLNVCTRKYMYITCRRTRHHQANRSLCVTIQHVCMYICMFMYTYAYMYMSCFFMYICMFMYTYTYILCHVCMCLCMFMYTYIQTRTHIHINHIHKVFWCTQKPNKKFIYARNT